MITIYRYRNAPLAKHCLVSGWAAVIIAGQNDDLKGFLKHIFLHIVLMELFNFIYAIAFPFCFIYLS
jgi:hypothetical protein